LDELPTAEEIQESKTEGCIAGKVAAM